MGTAKVTARPTTIISPVLQSFLFVMMFRPLEFGGVELELELEGQVSASWHFVSSAMVFESVILRWIEGDKDRRLT